MEALLCVLLYEKLKSCILDRAPRRSQVEFIDPRCRRVVGEAAAVPRCLDQPLYTAFDPLPSGGGCKVSVVRTGGFVPAAIPWSIAPHFPLPFFSRIEAELLQDLSATGVCRLSASDGLRVSPCFRF